MNKTFVKMIFFIIIGMSITSCERDDICPQNTLKTPTAHILFFNSNGGRPIETTIGNIKFHGLEGKTPLAEISPESDLKSIRLPLDFENEQSRFLMINTNSQTDTLTIKYSPKLTFISKACGYRFTFENTTVDCTQDHLIEAISKDIEAEPANGYLFNPNQTCAILYLIPQS